jgi:hypothetical protein
MWAWSPSVAFKHELTAAGVLQRYWQFKMRQAVTIATGTYYCGEGWKPTVKNNDLYLFLNTADVMIMNGSGLF